MFVEFKFSNLIQLINYNKSICAQKKNFNLFIPNYSYYFINITLTYVHR